MITDKGSEENNRIHCPSTGVCKAIQCSSRCILAPVTCLGKYCLAPESTYLSGRNLLVNKLKVPRCFLLTNLSLNAMFGILPFRPNQVESPEQGI